MKKINFPIVGIGASAGGLKVLQDFFDYLDDDNEMAFVVITHLAPKKHSSLDELLASHTSMQVQQIKGKTEIHPSCIYIIPPGKQLYMEGNELLLGEKEKDHQAVIDVFFRSMAKECEKLSIGIILSGTGSDGTLGLKAVKEYGGITMVQDPQEATYNGMPQSAIDTDLVDFILPVKELAQKVVDHKEVLENVMLPLQDADLSTEESTALQKVFNVLSSKKGHDFKHYKRSSVLRRLQRRMYITTSKSIHDYQQYLEKNPAEINDLFKDLLISVTNFFRDPEAFEFLEKKIIPKLFEGKKPEDPNRIWITGCASGEEVYSLAILLHEYAAANLDYMPHIKIFGTDISDEALRIARRAVYPETISTDISEERMQRYFRKEEAGYRVCSEIRERVLISNHDILSDPPFLNQDLIACRNLLIYFNQNLQNEVLKILHYALRPGGFLFMGLADSTIGATDLFAPVNKGNAIYKARQVPVSRKDIPRFPLLPNPHRSRSIDEQRTDHANFSFDKVHYSLLANQYAPASIIIDENNQVMHSSKGVDRYLNYTEGEPTRDLLKMASPQIIRSLRNIIFQFNQLEEPRAIAQKAKIDDRKELKIVKIGVQPIESTDFPSGFRQITFEEINEEKTKAVQKEPSEHYEDAESEIVAHLEAELEQTKEQLRQTIEEYETSNEELMASNEELQSMNEELHTSTEELEMSKEELQSVNEELRTVNQELENKIDEIKQANDDLKNLMAATEIGIIFLDSKLDIRLYTRNATNLFHLIDSDIGRPLAHVTHELRYDNLISDLKKMLNNSNSIQKQLTTNDGDWYLMQIKPYKIADLKVGGAVLTFVDITDLKKAEEELLYQAQNEESLATLGRFTLEHIEIQPILDKAVNMLSDKLGVDFTTLMKANLENKKLLFIAKSGRPDDLDPAKDFDATMTQNSEVDYVLKKKSPISITNFAHDDRFNCSGWLLDQEITSGILVRVKGSKKLFGVLGVYAKSERSFTSHEIHFVQNAANMIGEAVERIQTEIELREAYKELELKIVAEKKLQREILDVEKEERWRLGQYLHDGTAQNLVGIKMLLDIIDPKLQQLDEKTRTDLKKIKRLVVKSEKNLRELSHFVLPLEDDEKISKAFKKLVGLTEELYGTTCDFVIKNSVDEIKDPASATSLYYITQEAIRNAAIHGQADKIKVTLSAEGKFLHLTIADNGVGYDHSKKGDGRGINIMKHRAELLGGSLDISRSPETGKGTLVNCTIPLKKHNKEN